MQCDSWGVTSLFVGVLLQMVEISRVLQPGGVFVASTFLKTFSPLGELLGDDTVRPLNQVSTFATHVLTCWCSLCACNACVQLCILSGSGSSCYSVAAVC